MSSMLALDGNARVHGMLKRDNLYSAFLCLYRRCQYSLKNFKDRYLSVLVHRNLCGVGQELGDFSHVSNHDAPKRVGWSKIPVVI